MPEIEHNSLVAVEVVDMASLPVGSNPFHYDMSSMGTELVRGWTAMHAGYDRKDEPRALNGMYLYNARSGQRIRLKFVARPTTKHGHALAAAELLNQVRIHLRAAGLDSMPLLSILGQIFDAGKCEDVPEVFSTIPPTL